MNWIHELRNIRTWKRYSQANEESYLEHILNHVPPVNRHLVELGAWDGFHLSNTRHFIENGYSSLLVDGDNHGNEEVKKHFITRENVNEILALYATPKSFDLLCVDLDGNDLYIIQEILTAYRPSVIIAEFNPIFQPFESVAIEYNPLHTWGEDDYYGFSFAAGKRLAEKFGYKVIFQNDNLNMYFVSNQAIEESLKDADDKTIPDVVYDVRNYHPASNSEKANWVPYV